MKKLRLIYNPYSGSRTFGENLDLIIGLLQNSGYEVCPFRIGGSLPLSEAFGSEFSAFAAAGGDGTINIVLNHIMNKGLNHIPLAVFPSGTANDFASFLDLPQNSEEICKIIGENRTVPLDIGKAGTKYFINVCAGGLFSDISSIIDNNLKANIGRLAYYIEAVRQITEYTPLELKITASEGKVFHEKAVLFLALNSSGTGGIKNLTPAADMQDGHLDFLFFRDCDVLEVPKLLIQYFKGELPKNKNILHFKDKSVKIECFGGKTTTDIDGEVGDNLPLTIENIPKAIKLFL